MAVNASIALGRLLIEKDVPKSSKIELVADLTAADLRRDGKDVLPKLYGALL